MYLVILEVLFSGEEENKYIELLIWGDLVKLILFYYKYILGRLCYNKFIEKFGFVWRF